MLASDIDPSNTVRAIPGGDLTGRIRVCVALSRVRPVDRRCLNIVKPDRSRFFDFGVTLSKPSPNIEGK